MNQRKKSTLCSSRFLIPLIYSALSIRNANAFTSVKINNFSNCRKTHVRNNRSSLNSIGGVPPFESWWSSQPPNEKLQHALFENGDLRGLEYLGSFSGKEVVCTVPRQVVLQTPYGGNENWDRDLALLLLRECRIGNKSEVYGYCSLLTQGKDYSTAPSTAPDALRHWTDDQKSLLASAPAGQRLLDLEQKQSDRWEQKYRSLSPADRDMFTLKEFIWAMEAVHSRAFCGDFGIRNEGGGSLALNLGVPLVASILGATALTSPNLEYGDIIATGCAVIAFTPLLIFLLDKKTGDALMLPFIDSANHIEGVDSLIEFDPIRDRFTLTIGDNCLVEDGSGKQQLFISYGKKSDEELMINYGFLPGVVLGKGVGEEVDKREVKRRLLAEAFLKRNS